MEVEIKKDLKLSQKQACLLDMHSFLNIMNVLTGEITYMGNTSGKIERLMPALKLCQVIASQLDERNATVENCRKLDDHEYTIFSNLRAVMQESSPGVREELARSFDNIETIFSILKIRVREILARLESPDEWINHSIAALNMSFNNLFAAVEKNSRGRYRIVYNIAEQESRDYVVHFNIKGVDGDNILMPPVVQDVMRDLIANARKYTDPGGSIRAGLLDNGEQLRIIVEDTGRGIPEDQLESVVDFGVRATNTGDVASRGGGFGLTKAYVVARQFRGRMWIRSEVDKGTRVKVAIPRPGKELGSKV